MYDVVKLLLMTPIIFLVGFATVYHCFIVLIFPIFNYNCSQQQN